MIDLITDYFSKSRFPAVLRGDTEFSLTNQFGELFQKPYEKHKHDCGGKPTNTMEKMVKKLKKMSVQ